MGESDGTLGWSAGTMEVGIDELYLAFRQAKATIFYDRATTCLLDLAKYESQLEARLPELADRLRNSCWFDALSPGKPTLRPKRLLRERGDDGVHEIGGLNGPARELEVQLRLEPEIEFAIVEVLYMWRFGPMLERLLCGDVVGYRLHLREGRVDRTARWLYSYWPGAYRRFRDEPLRAASRAIERSGGAPVSVLSLDLANFFGSVDPAFLTAPRLLRRLLRIGATSEDVRAYHSATKSLLAAFSRYETRVRRYLGSGFHVGIPIGSVASKLLANVALGEVDERLRRHPAVMCYRRYVDDIVVVSRLLGADEDSAIAGAVAALLPVRSRGHRIEIDSSRFGLTGSTLAIQTRKARIHVLRGEPGQDFISAVKAEFDAAVSGTRRFVDETAFVDSSTADILTTSGGRVAPLTVLRDADAISLEKFRFSTRLRTLERVSSLLAHEEARRAAAPTLAVVSRTLESDTDWVKTLDAAFRTLQIATQVEGVPAFRRIVRAMDGVFGTVDALRRGARELSASGVRLTDRDRAWRLVVRHLCDRRVQAVASSLRITAQASRRGTVGAVGLTGADGRVLGAIALLTRARLLSDADLRARDREDDGCARLHSHVDERWLEDLVASGEELSSRFDLLREFSALGRAGAKRPWALPPAKLFLCTRPPSYFDVARRVLYGVEEQGFAPGVFRGLLETVNAIRGTRYRSPAGRVRAAHTVEIPPRSADRSPDEIRPDPLLALGNLVSEERWWRGSASWARGRSDGSPVLTVARLLGLARVLGKAASVAARRVEDKHRPTMLVLPELSIPQRWVRPVSNHVVRFGRHSLVMGVEYLHEHDRPVVRNQAIAVLPTPYQQVATWPWTKRNPADEERRSLSALEVSAAFPRRRSSDHRRRVVVDSPFGRFSVLICSELLEATRLADLLGRTELLLVPAWNRDTASYDHLIQSAGLQLHNIVAVANNGRYSDCRAWAPLSLRWERDLCRLIERGEDDLVHVLIPLGSLRAFHVAGGQTRGVADGGDSSVGWRPLPPDWPRGGGESTDE